ncbi:site-specific recombinase, phage integrase family [Bordetella bronchiseptica F-1]|nr:site-specific recombinase, phage integrase family [Bordetella bronchiseptica F-1]
MALSDLIVRQAKTAGKRYTLYDNDCLSLMVSAAGGKSWIFRYCWLGKQKRMSLGSYPALSLREARAERDKAQVLLAKGIDPQIERDQRRHAARLAGEYTFKNVFDAWVEHRRKELKEGRQSTLSQILRIFNKDVLPTLGKMSIYDIRRPQLVGVVAAIEKRKAFTTAEKVRTWFNQMFRYALVIAEGLEVNPAADLDVVAEPKPPVAHNPYLHLPELPEFLQKLRRYNPRGWQTQLGVRLLFLTGVRTGELRLAEPEQFDLDRGLWIIPPQVVKQLQDEMRKAGKRPQDVPPYIVPLSLQAIEIVRYLLGVMRPAQKYLLSHRSELKKRISENTLNKAVQLMGYEGRLTGHGIRGTISTALNEIGYPKIWVDAQLSHSDPNKVSSAYNHAKYVEPRRRMMQDWADRLDLLEQGEVEAASAHLTIRIDGVPAMAEVEEALGCGPHGGRARCPRRAARCRNAHRRDSQQRRDHVPAAVAGAAASGTCPGAGSLRDPARARGNAGHLRVAEQFAGPAVRQAGRQVQGPDQPRAEGGQAAVHQPGQPGAAGSRLATGAAQAQAGPGAHEPVPARGFVGPVPHADPATPRPG